LGSQEKALQQLFFKLNALINTIAEPALTQRWRGHRIFCVDGTKLNLPRALLARGFRKPSDTSYYPQGLVSCLFNLLIKTPHDFLFTKNYNEIHAAKRLIVGLRKGDVIVYDRAFLSYDMLIFHIRHGLNAVFRTKGSQTLGIVTTFLAQSHSDDCVVSFNYKGFGLIKVRLIRYYINNKPYCLLTTLLNQKHYTIRQIQDLYHARWGVEEFFKLSKTYLNIKDAQRGRTRNRRTFCSTQPIPNYGYDRRKFN
jgi:IS4 transposase